MKKMMAAIFLSIHFLSTHALTVTLQMNFENTNRSFLVHTPPGFQISQHLSLVFNLHGYGSDAAQQEFYSRMSETADANQFIVVYPNGISNAWNSGFTVPYNSSPDDVGFISKIIDTMATLYNINTNRVYACGMSNGGYQSYRLACDLESRIAAVASVTGVLSALTAFNCTNQSRKVPVLQIHGTADPLVPYNGSTGSKSVEETVAFWLSGNQCSAVSDTVHYTDVDLNDSSTVERIRYASCGDGVEVVFYKITGGGHTWPNTTFDWIYGPTNRDFDASQEIWDFFNRFTLQGPVSGVVVLEKNALEVKVFPNPAADHFLLHILNGQDVGHLLSVYDFLGRKIIERSLDSKQNTIPIDGLISGIYLLKVEEENGRFWTQRIVCN